MNYLNGKRCYLSGSIHSTKDDGIEWRNIITQKLVEIGVEVLDPCKTIIGGNMDLSEVGKNKEKFRKLIMTEDWGKVKKEFWPIVRKDLKYVDFCDFIVFNYDASLSMVGTIHELVVAQFEKKVILMKYQKDQLSNDFNPWICTFIKPHHFFPEWDDMMEYLKKVDDGVFDTSLWVI